MNGLPTPATLSEAYRASRHRLTEIARGITSDAERAIVPTCPAWTVRDLISHNVGLASDLSAGRVPSGDTQKWVDDMVTARAETPVAEQLNEWEDSGAAFEALLLERPQLAALVVDVVSHEHDLAGALGITSDRTAAEIGLVLDLTRRSTGKDLAAHGLSAVELVTTDRTWQYGEGDVELTVRGSAFELFRLTGGRRSMNQLLATDHDGDMARYAAGLVHNPLPDVDIIE